MKPMQANRLTLMGVCLVLAAGPAWAENSMGTAVNDTVVTSKVKTALIGNPDTQARKINVETRDGQVQLNGFVDSPHEKMAAESAARSVDGVRSVSNNLQVKSGEATVGSVVDDSVITAKVKAALIGDSRTKAHEITVDTSKGVVALGGTVASAAEKTAAESVARNVDGVTRVENGIALEK